MKTEKTLQKAGWIVAALVAIVVVTVFAAMNQNETDRESVSDTHSANLKNVINARQTWDVAFASWSGKEVPDFTVTDIDGTTHRLSDYQGKGLVLVFWATWCPACNTEIPHLIELRKMYPDDELTILAISNESREPLKSFAEAKGINYTVAVPEGRALPEPFSNVRSIPTTFFIGRDGTLTVAALGVVPVEQAKAIIEAQADHE